MLGYQRTAFNVPSSLKLAVYEEYDNSSVMDEVYHDLGEPKFPTKSFMGASIYHDKILFSKR